MSHEATKWMWDHSQARTATFMAVAVALADHANERGYAWPAVITLAAKARTDLGTVRDALAQMQRDGEIVRIPASEPLPHPEDEAMRRGVTAWLLTLRTGAPNVREAKRDALRRKEADRRVSDRRKAAEKRAAAAAVAGDRPATDSEPWRATDPHRGGRQTRTVAGDSPAITVKGTVSGRATADGADQPGQPGTVVDVPTGVTPVSPRQDPPQQDAHETEADLRALVLSLPYAGRGSAARTRLVSDSRGFRAYRLRDLPADVTDRLTLCPVCGTEAGHRLKRWDELGCWRGDPEGALRPDDPEVALHAAAGPVDRSDLLVLAVPPPSPEELRAQADRRLDRWEQDTGQHLNGHRTAYVDAWAELTGEGVADALLCEVLSGLGRYLHDRRGPTYLRDRARQRTSTRPAQEAPKPMTLADIEARRQAEWARTQAALGLAQ